MYDGHDLKIREVTQDDFNPVFELVKRVSESDIFPHLMQDGKDYFISDVLPDIQVTFGPDFSSFVMESCDLLVGFGAIRSDDYITHLFIDEKHQARGLGKQLLKQLLGTAKSNEVRLKASVNSVGFYIAQGFRALDKETVLNGVRFVPMNYEVSQEKSAGESVWETEPQQ